jgi:hypothetical protein
MDLNGDDAVTLAELRTFLRAVFAALHAVDPAAASKDAATAAKEIADLAGAFFCAVNTINLVFEYSPILLQNIRPPRCLRRWT